MKPKKLAKRLTVAKESIQNLEEQSLAEVQGGAETLPPTKIVSGCL